MRTTNQTLSNARHVILYGAGLVLLLSAISLAIDPRSRVEYFYFPAVFVLIVANFRWQQLGRADLLFAAMVLAPFVAFILANFIHSETYGLVRRIASDPYFWLEYGATSALLIFGILCARDLDKVARVGLPLGLGLTFVILTIYKISPGDGPYVCRVLANVDLPFTPATVFSCFALLYFVIAPGFGRREHLLSGVFLAAAVLIIFAYTGSRGVFVGLLLSFLLMGGALLIFRRGPWRLSVGLLLGALVVGTATSVALDGATGCNGVNRFQAMMDPSVLPQGAEQDLTQKRGAIELRVVMWRVSFDHLLQSPWIGWGRLAEANLLLPTGQDHAHQQYLSWMLWFGVPGLVVGLACLLAPAVAFVKRGVLQDRILLFAATCSLLPGALLFDSLMRIKQFIVFQVLFSAIAYVVIKQIYARTDGNATPKSP